MTQPDSSPPEPVEVEVIEPEAVEEPTALARQMDAAPQWLTAEDQRLVRDTIARDLPEPEFRVFMSVARRVRLDPLSRQIYGIMRKGKLSIQTGIDGFRLIARRDGLAGIDDAIFRYTPDDTAEQRPISATVTVHRWAPNGQRESYTATARMSEYSAGSQMWSKMPHQMLAKCAEACALRKGFQECSGLYTSDEMGQADKPAPQVRQQPKPQGNPKIVEAEKRLGKWWHRFCDLSGLGAMEIRHYRRYWAKAAGLPLDGWPDRPTLDLLHKAADTIKAKVVEIEASREAEPEPEPAPNSPADVGFEQPPEPYQAPDVGTEPDGTQYDTETGEVIRDVVPDVAGATTGRKTLGDIAAELAKHVVPDSGDKPDPLQADLDAAWEYHNKTPEERAQAEAERAAEQEGWES